MRPLGVVEVDPLRDDPHRFEAVGQLVQVDGLVLERAPQALDEDVIHAATPPIHRDRDLRAAEHAGDVDAGELAGRVDKKTWKGRRKEP